MIGWKNQDGPSGAAGGKPPVRKGTTNELFAALVTQTSGSGLSICIIAHITEQRRAFYHE